MRDVPITPIAASGAAIAVALMLSGCGAIAEEAIEQAVEADIGEEVEIDFDSEDGTFTIEGDNGEAFSLDVDEDGGASVMSSTDEDGNTFEMVTGQELPDAWPGDIPEPPGEITTSTVMSENDRMTLSVVSEVDNAIDAYEDYVDELTDRGFSVDSQSSFESDGNQSQFGELSNDTWRAQVAAFEDSGSSSLTISLQPNEG